MFRRDIAAITPTGDDDEHDHEAGPVRPDVDTVSSRGRISGEDALWPTGSAQQGRASGPAGGGGNEECPLRPGTQGVGALPPMIDPATDGGVFPLSVRG